MNEGCIPTKTLLRSAEVIHEVRDRAAEFGVRGVDPAAISFDLAAAVARKDEIVRHIIEGIYSWVNRSDNLTFIRGRAEFDSPVDIRVDDRRISAAKSILAPGSRTGDATIPPPPTIPNGHMDRVARRPVGEKIGETTTPGAPWRTTGAGRVLRRGGWKEDR